MSMAVFLPSEHALPPKVVGYALVFITVRKQGLGQGNIFTGVCLSTVGTSVLRKFLRKIRPGSVTEGPCFAACFRIVNIYGLSEPPAGDRIVSHCGFWITM